VAAWLRAWWTFWVTNSQGVAGKPKRSAVRRSYEGRTKSGKDRLVPIPAALVPILQQHRLADPWKGPLVFPNEEGGICYSKNSKPGKFLE
jgi:integrase